MIALTYDEWRRLDYGVIKGQHSTGRNDEGDCTFTEHQVIKICENWRPYSWGLFTMPEERGFPPPDD